MDLLEFGKNQGNLLEDPEELWEEEEEEEEDDEEEEGDDEDEEGEEDEGDEKGEITEEILRKILPEASDKGITEGIPALFQALAEKDLTSKNQLIGVLATLYVETTTCEPIEEMGKGGGAYVASNGKNYYGRGFVQITWEENYKAFSDDEGIDILNNPEKALEPGTAGKVFVWYWTKNGVDDAAEDENWDDVRSIVNAGSPGKIGICHGVEKFMECVERAKQYLPGGLDKNKLGVSSGSEGLGCLDSDGTGTNLTGEGLSPISNGEAIAQLLGIYKRDASRAFEFSAILNPAADPSVLNLKPQTTFEVKGFSELHDGIYTVEAVLITMDYNGQIEMEVTGHKEDPDAPKPMVFSHNTNIGNGVPSTSDAPESVPSGEINQKLYEIADKQARGKSSAAGPDGGVNACAYAVNNFVIVPAGLKELGDNPVYCPSCVDALEGGRGKKVDRQTTEPGDIWFAWDMRHIGIVMGGKGSEVVILSNSSSRASFDWEDTIDNVNSIYGGEEHGIYRLTS